METKKSKVTVSEYKNESTGKFGLQYYHNIEFENGDKGTYTSKRKDQVNFIVGQEADYTIETKINGQYTNVFIKPVMPADKPSFGGKAAFIPKDPKIEMISYAMSYAKDLVVGKAVKIEELPAYFDKIYNEMLNRLPK